MRRGSSNLEQRSDCICTDAPTWPICMLPKINPQAAGARKLEDCRIWGCKGGIPSWTYPYPTSSKRGTTSTWLALETSSMSFRTRPSTSSIFTLCKSATCKAKEQKLTEAFQSTLEANMDLYHDTCPSRMHHSLSRTIKGPV